jgi:antitoxin component YwqK of YwqJK toxin-antitoxin module
MRYTFILLAAIFLATSCGTSLVKRTESGAYYTEEYMLRKKDQVKHGPYKKYTLDGQLLEEGVYEEGEVNGIRKKYVDGKIAAIETVKEGVFHGLYQSFYPNGGVNSEGFYDEEQMVGVWKRFYKNGQVLEEVTFEDNIENGPFKEYYENGNIKAEGAYLNGDQEHGELLLYNEKGELIRKMNCVEGICRTTWEKDSESN